MINKSIYNEIFDDTLIVKRIKNKLLEGKWIIEKFIQNGLMRGGKSFDTNNRV